MTTPEPKSEPLAGGVDSRQGLLDLTVNLSSPQIFSGADFALYLHVKNPFDRPVWIHRVVTNLPATVHQKSIEHPSVKHNKDSVTPADMTTAINTLKTLIDAKRTELRTLAKAEDETTKDAALDLRMEIRHLEDKLVDLASRGDYDMIDGGDNATVTVSRHTRPLRIRTGDRASVSIEGGSEEGYVSLRGSLPEGTSLMPGCEDAMTITLNTTRNPFFLPATYRLNLIVQYSFEPPESNPDIFANTVPFTVAIRAAMLSVMLGSVTGAIGGAAGRLLQQSSGNLNSLDATSAWISIALAAILSMAAAVFSARKSETQSFVTVEDFWGGALVGFLIGYSGTAAFQNFTRFPGPSPA